MLILSRKIEESIVIDENITVKVIAIDKGSVKIGIDAPSNISILRSELLKEVEKTNVEAAKPIDSTFLDMFYNKFKK